MRKKENTPIICRYCSKDTGMTEEGFTYLVLKEDVKCPHCDKIIINIVKIIH